MKANEMEIVTILNASKNEENLHHSYIAGRNLNDTATLENSLAVFFKKLNIYPSYDPSVMFLSLK